MSPEDLIEIHHIEQLKYRYLRFVDLKMWDDVESTLIPEATATYGGGAYQFSNRAEILAFLAETMTSEARITTHKAHQPEIILEGPERASGTWALEDKVIDTEFGFTVEGAAFYFDRYVKIDGTWLIEHTGYKRVYEQLQPRSADISLTASWWATDGRSKLAATED